MSIGHIEETFEVYNEFAKHLLKISNKNDLLNISLTNINTGLFFEDIFNLEKLNKLANNYSNFSTIDSITKILCDLIKKNQFQLTTNKNYMLLTFLNPVKDLEELPIPLPYLETPFCKEDERVLQKRDIELILSWINPKKSLRLRLLYKATRDGDTPINFHKKVDGIKNTVTVILTDKGYRCGGFVTKEWNTYGDFNKNDVDSFLFSLDKRKRYLISMEGSTSYNHPNYGPTFGRGFDLAVGENVSSIFSSNQNSCKFPSSYGDNSDINLKCAITGGYENFLVREIETYEVVSTEDFGDDDEDDEEC